VQVVMLRVAPRKLLIEVNSPAQNGNHFHGLLSSRTEAFDSSD
jgi:hypothetical protein